MHTCVYTYTYNYTYIEIHIHILDMCAHSHRGGERDDLSMHVCIVYVLMCVFVCLSLCAHVFMCWCNYVCI